MTNNYITPEEEYEIKKHFCTLIYDGMPSGKATMETAKYIGRHDNTIRKLVNKWLKSLKNNKQFMSKPPLDK